MESLILTPTQALDLLRTVMGGHTFDPYLDALSAPRRSPARAALVAAIRARLPGLLREVLC